MSNKTKTHDSADCHGSITSNDQDDNTTYVGLTQLECIITAHTKGNITTEQSGSIIKDRCQCSYNWGLR